MGSNHEKVRQGERILLFALSDYVCKELKQTYGAHWWEDGVLDILYDDQYIRHRTANASKPLADHASVGRIRVFAELDSGGSLALEYVVLDALDEVLVLTSSSTELEVLRDEDIDPEERKCQEDDHDPSALGS